MKRLVLALAAIATVAGPLAIDDGGLATGRFTDPTATTLTTGALSFGAATGTEKCTHVCPTSPPGTQSNTVSAGTKTTRSGRNSTRRPACRTAAPALALTYARQNGLHTPR